VSRKDGVGRFAEWAYSNIINRPQIKKRVVPTSGDTLRRPDGRAVAGDPSNAIDRGCGERCRD
jgi:hypothetical protein